jgi:hypothetical protein
MVHLINGLVNISKLVKIISHNVRNVIATHNYIHYLYNLWNSHDCLISELHPPACILNRPKQFIKRNVGEVPTYESLVKYYPQLMVYSFLNCSEHDMMDKVQM